MPATAPRVRRGAAVACRLAETRDDLQRHFAVRHAVFVAEQALFTGGDHDERDDDPATLHAIGTIGGETGGAVRLYPLDGARLWKGDRLAVLAHVRHGLLGAALVRFAVATAGERGGDRMVAMIQLPNVRFFQALGWQVCGSRTRYHGVDHQPMDIMIPSRGGEAPVSRRAR